MILEKDTVVDYEFHSPVVISVLTDDVTHINQSAYWGLTAVLEVFCGQQVSILVNLEHLFVRFILFLVYFSTMSGIGLCNDDVIVIMS